MPSVVGSEVKGDPLASAAERVLTSKTFERAHRLHELLRYLVSQTVSGDLQGLKEPIIGQRVFGRPCDYNAAGDNIVRSNVRQLRLKLEQYYAAEGLSEAWRITIPKGSYSVSVVPSAAAEEGEISEFAPVLAPAEILPVRRKPRRLWAITVLAFLSAASIAAVFFYDARQTTLLHFLQPPSGRRVLLIGADANLQLFERLTHRHLSLQEYLDNVYRRPDTLDQVVPGLHAVAPQLFAATGTEWFVTASIPEFTRILKATSLYVPAPQEITLHDLRRDNALLMSGPFGNPWVQLFDRDLNFQITTDPSGQRVFILNRAPAPKERRIYENYVDATQTVICYARLAYLPGSSTSRVILAGGPHHASTRAALLFLTRPDLYRVVRSALSVSSLSSLPWFEAVIEARALGSEPWSFRIAAIRQVHVRSTISSQ